MPKSAGSWLHQAAKLWLYRWAGTSDAKLSFPVYTQSSFLTPVHAYLLGFHLFFQYLLSGAELFSSLFTWCRLYCA